MKHKCARGLIEEWSRDMEAAEAYAQGHAEGMAEGLVLGAANADKDWQEKLMVVVNWCHDTIKHWEEPPLLPATTSVIAVTLQVLAKIGKLWIDPSLES